MIGKHTSDSAKRPDVGGRDVAGAKTSNSQVSPPAEGILALQRSVGNAAVGRLIAAGRARQDHQVNLDGHVVQANAARGGPTTSIPPSRRALAEGAAGHDLSDVRVHDDPAAWALNGDMGTAALTIGRDVFVRKGADQPSSTRGAELIHHELGHVLEGRPGAHAAAIDTSRVDVTAERDYAAAATIFESKLGPHLSAKAETQQIADDMLARLRQIVDAWADATKVGKKKAYGEEFNFPTGKEYYGSFTLTADEVKKVFVNSGQPLRKKLNLVYYATRNGNLAKYLEVAANELRLAHAAGKTKADQKVGVKSDTAEGEVSVKGGFAEKSGLKGRWGAGGAPIAGKSSKEEVEADLATRLGKAGAKAPVLGGFGQASGMGKSNRDLRGDKRYGTYRGLDLEDTETLTRGDVTDITSAEIRLLYQRAGKRQPRWISAKDKAKFKAKGAKRIMWEQGGQNIEVAADSETRRIAEATMSRLEGGISGSTDLMFHAAKHLGYTGAADLKKLRLALVAWMLSNRDHSFFEIMKVAADYGAPFNIDPNVPGGEYEHHDNFAPLPGPQVDNFKTLMPGQHMPSYFVGGAHKGQLDTNLLESGTTSDAFVGQLRTAGLTLDDSWNGDPKSKDLAQWLALKARVADLNLQAGHTEAALKANRIKVQALQKDPAWHRVGRPSVDPNAILNLRQLLASQFGATAVVSDAHLVTAGVAAGLVTGIEEYKRYDVLRLRRAVEAAAPAMKSPEAHTDAVARLTKSPAYGAVNHWLGSATSYLILEAMLAGTLSNARSTSTEKAAATDSGDLATFKTTYPDLDAQKTRLVSLGLPRSVADHVASNRDGIDSSSRTAAVIFFRLDQLQQAVAAAGHQAGQSPTSNANTAARKTVLTSPAYKALSWFLKPDLTGACISSFTSELYGAGATTAAEDEVAF
jgi:hypothetical protein